MLDSLYTGTAGIKANSTALGTVGSNIANVSTVGYKASRSSFANVLNESMAIGTVGEQEVWTQGSLEQTEVTTDLAIVGDGMFTLADDAGALYYTRDGSFSFDDSGTLVNTSGLAVQGYEIDTRGQLGTVGDITIDSVNSAPKASEELSINFNLDGEYSSATAVVDCSDNLSSVTFTAISAGVGGNDISVSYTQTPGDGPMTVAANGNAITVSIGDSRATAAQVAAKVNAYFEGAASVEVGEEDSAVLYVAAEPGSSGDNISVEYVKPVVANTTGTGDGAVTLTADGATVPVTTITYAAAGASAAPSVSVTGNDITVTLGATATNNTAENIADVINASTAASALVTATYGGDGSDLVTAHGSQSLASTVSAELSVSVTGNDITVILGTDTTGAVVSSSAEIAAAIHDNTDASALVTAYASGDGTGVVEAVAATNLEDGDDTSITSQQLGGVATGTLDSGEAAVLFAADRTGEDGNNIQIVYSNPGADSSLSVSVSGDVITVSLATDSSGAVISTAQEIADLINDPDEESSSKITAYAAGSEVVTVTGSLTLSGGTSSPLTSVVRAEAEGNGSGLVEAKDPIELSGGVEPDDFSTTTTVYDSLGNGVELTIDFIFDPITSYNEEDGVVEQIAQWTWVASSSEGDASGYGTLRFDSTGQLDRINSTWDTEAMTDPPDPSYSLRDDGNPTIAITDLTSGASDISLTWDLTNSTLITGFAADSEIRSQTQDGYAAGSLEDISVDEDGTVWGSFSNGQSRALYQVGLTTFSDYGGLSSQGSNIYSATVESGVGLFGTADTGGRGTISPGSLEQSNVDMAEEFVKLITIQRAYQANSKVITTSADILQELVAMKR